jgi:hypothetical protein
MQLLVDYTLALGFPLTLVSVGMMGRYLVQNRVSTWWQLRTTLLWPEMIFKYRDHSRRHRGRTGSWYYVFSVAIILVVLAGSLDLAIITAPAPLPILIAVWFTYLLFVPLLAVVIYNLSKVK